MPRSLRDIVAERIAGVDEDVAELLGQAAVLGASFTPADLAALAGIDERTCTTRADEAVRHGLLRLRRDALAFVSDVVRQVAYESSPSPVRVSRHRRAARMFDARPETAARHYAAAGDWSSAADAWTAAAEVASRAFANNEAVELLSKAVGAARSAGDVVVLVQTLLRRGRACSQIGRHDDAVADHEQALELARGMDDSELEARALEQLGWTALYARDAMAAVDLAEQATELAESAAAAPGALPSATLLLGRVRHWDGDYAGAGTAYEQVLGSGPDDSTRGMALAYQGALLQHMDRFTEAKTVLARAAALCRRTGEFRPCSRPSSSPHSPAATPATSPAPSAPSTTPAASSTPKKSASTAPASKPPPAGSGKNSARSTAPATTPNTPSNSPAAAAAHSNSNKNSTPCSPSPTATCSWATTTPPPTSSPPPPPPSTAPCPSNPAPSCATSKCAPAGNPNTPKPCSSKPASTPHPSTKPSPSPHSTAPTKPPASPRPPAPTWSSDSSARRPNGARRRRASPPRSRRSYARRSRGRAGSPPRAYARPEGCRRRGPAAPGRRVRTQTDGSRHAPRRGRSPSAGGAARGRPPAPRPGSSPGVGRRCGWPAARARSSGCRHGPRPSRRPRGRAGGPAACCGTGSTASRSPCQSPPGSPGSIGNSRTVPAGSPSA
ncbi:tetratricopeptide repeat protein [Pseudonocardia benzenivorans]